MNAFLRRRERLIEKLKEKELGGFLVSRPVDLSYLTGFWGEGTLVVTSRGAWLLADGRYAEEGRTQAKEVTVVPYGAGQEGYFKVLGEVLAGAGIRRLGFEADFLTFEAAEELKQKLDFLELVPVSGLLRLLRARKEEEEISFIRAAAELTCAAFDYLLSFLRPGLREKEVAWELEYFLRRQGAERPAFEVIVASGPRAAYPHARAAERMLAPGDLVVVDFGAVKEGYSADFTRTLVLGEPAREQRERHALVLAAQEAALNVLKPGETCARVDAAAREVISAGGYGAHFAHSLGHGVGLEVHELPVLAPGKEETLLAGMVVTVEPGIYLAGWGGIRVEDLVVVREGGPEVLTPAPRELIKL